MTKLELNNFKAHIDLSIDFSKYKKNFLLYGDNGAGKSSIYEAIKVIFFKERISQEIPKAKTNEEQEQFNSDFWSKYNNKISNNNFELKINDTDYTDFSSENYQVFMLSLEELFVEEPIRLDELLKNFYFAININIFCHTNYENIQNKVNKTLSSFRENIQIVIDNEDYFKIRIIDIRRNLDNKAEIKKYFNEAKLNLVVLLLLFESIKILSMDSKTKILVLDDFITSLDIANRTFLMQYIFDNFKDFQILIFTHNVYFYNLIMYIIKDIYSADNKLKLDRWIFANLYEIENNHKLYINNSMEKVSKIREKLKGTKSIIVCSECNKKNTLYNNIEPENIGNIIRQKFEVLLYEFSKLLMIGAVEDSKKILDRIENSKSIYFNGKKTASDLIDELEKVLDLDNPQNLQNSLKRKIQSYKQDGFSDIQDIVRKLKLYQKVTLHPMSHGTMGQNSFTINEINESLDLLEKFENYIIGLIGSDVDGA